MPRNWTEGHALKIALPFVLAGAIGGLGGCASNTGDLLSHDSNTMLDIWHHQTDASNGGDQASRRLLDARQMLRRPLTRGDAAATDIDTSYTRTASNEIQRQFKRLPNPDLVMYVFPHLAGTDPVPVPGYSTVFPLYQRVQYAMPGERVEDY